MPVKHIALLDQLAGIGKTFPIATEPQSKLLFFEASGLDTGVLTPLTFRT